MQCLRNGTERVIAGSPGYEMGCCIFHQLAFACCPPPRRLHYSAWRLPGRLIAGKSQGALRGSQWLRRRVLQESAAPWRMVVVGLWVVNLGMLIAIFGAGCWIQPSFSGALLTHPFQHRIYILLLRSLPLLQTFAFLLLFVFLTSSWMDFAE